MRKTVVSALVAVAASCGIAQPTFAGSSTDAALGLGAFAVFNQFLLGQTVFHQGLGTNYVVRERVVIHQQAPTVIYEPPPVVYHVPPPAVVYAPPPVIVYPNGHSYAVPHSHYKKHYWKKKHHKRYRHHDDDDDD